MKKGTGKRTKNAALLLSVAESIGSTLGTLAAKAGAAQKALTRSSVAHTVERQGKKLMRKGRGVARRTKNAAAQNLKRSKLARVTGRSLRRTISSAKRAVRSGTAKARAARRAKARR